MTLRAMAKILGISPAYLSLLVNGKRKWQADLKERYDELVNTFVNSTNRAGEKIVVPRKGLEPPLPLGKRILSHSEVHSPSDNVRLVYSFISDRKLRGLSPNTIRFYEGYFVTTQEAESFTVASYLDSHRFA